MLCHENQWNAQSLSQKFDVTIEFSYEIFPAPLFVSFWSGAVDVIGGYRNDVIRVYTNFYTSQLPKRQHGPSDTAACVSGAMSHASQTPPKG